MRSVCTLLMLVLAIPLCAEVTDEQFEEALEVWRSYDMPEPDAGVPLVVLEQGATHSINGVAQARSRLPAFVIREKSREQPASYLLGTYELSNGWTVVEDAEPDDAGTGRWPRLFVGSLFPVNNRFALALHCWSRGRHKLARGLMEVAMNERPLVNGGVQVEFSTVADWCAGTIWAYRANQVAEPGTDRAAILKALRQVFGDYKALKDRLDSRKQFIDELEETLKPPGANPSSLETRIDALLEMHEDYWSSGFGTQGSTAEPVLGLLLLGFEVVPTLIAHLDDRRMTRTLATRSAFDTFKTLLRVGDVALQIIEELAVQPFPTYYDQALTRRSAPKDDINEWWEATKLKIERDYFRAAFPFPPTYGLGRGALQVLGEKYPDALHELFLEAIDGPVTEFHFFLPRAVARSALSLADKSAALTKAAKSSSVEIRYPSLNMLATLDAIAAGELLVKYLDAIDASQETKDDYDPPILRYTQLMVGGLDKPLRLDQKVWNALARATGRVNANVRIRVLFWASCGYYEDVDKARCLALIAGFIGDDSERTHIGRQDFQAKEWNPLRVGDYACMLIGGILQLEATPKPDWSADQWSAFKAEVETVLKAEGIELPDAE